MSLLTLFFLSCMRRHHHPIHHMKVVLEVHVEKHLCWAKLCSTTPYLAGTMQWESGISEWETPPRETICLSGGWLALLRGPSGPPSQICRTFIPTAAEPEPESLPATPATQIRGWSPCCLQGYTSVSCRPIQRGWGGASSIRPWTAELLIYIKTHSLYALLHIGPGTSLCFYAMT